MIATVAVSVAAYLATGAFLRARDAERPSLEDLEARLAALLPRVDARWKSLREGPLARQGATAALERAFRSECLAPLEALAGELESGPPEPRLVAARRVYVLERIQSETLRMEAELLTATRVAEDSELRRDMARFRGRVKELIQQIEALPAPDVASPPR